MGEISLAFRGTRGAVVAVARIEPEGGRLLFCGVGDISACTEFGSSFPLDGPVGERRRRNPHTRPGSSLVLWPTTFAPSRPQR
jgi:hypothetical protein